MRDAINPSAAEADVEVEITAEGQIDSALRFTAPSRRYYKSSITFHLIMSDKHWEPGAAGEPSKETQVSQQWFIEGPINSVTLNLASAIRYVKESADKATDSEVKKNAEQTLTRLRKIH